MTGVGHAGIEETTATGARQTASGDRLEAHFCRLARQERAEGTRAGSTAGRAGSVGGAGWPCGAAEQPAAKPGAQPQPPMRATAGRAVYEGAGEWLHLTLSPRVEDGGTAN